jgi:phosphoribosylanthranilate isomerase
MADVAKESGADLIGLVFANSKRQVDSTTAREISRQVPGIGKVGVFVNAPLAEVQDIARQCKLDYVQLHGDESAAYCRQLALPVIKAIRPEAATIQAINDYPAEWILVDSYSQGRFGGSGVPFGWSDFQKVRQKITKSVIIAGGLHADNVKEAIQLLAPDGVDVSSGVECNGTKSAAKIKQFISAVREEGGYHA